MIPLEKCRPDALLTSDLNVYIAPMRGRIKGNTCF